MIFKDLAKYAAKIDDMREYELADDIDKLIKIAQQQQVPQQIPVAPTASPQIQTLQNSLNQLTVQNNKTEQRQDGLIARLQQQLKSLQNELSNTTGAQKDFMNDNENEQQSAQQTPSAQQNQQNQQASSPNEPTLNL